MRWCRPRWRLAASRTSPSKTRRWRRGSVPSTPQTARADIALGGTLAAAWSAFALGVRRNLANWPILMGRALFYLVAMTVLSALWDKVGSQRLAGTLAALLPPGGLTPSFGVTEGVALSPTPLH